MCSVQPAQDAELERLTEALTVLQADLGHSGYTLDYLTIVQSDGWDSAYDRLFYVGEPHGVHPGAGAPLTGRTEADALLSVARGVQDYMAELQRKIWPRCPQHASELIPELDDDGDPSQPTGSWWCHKSDVHRVAQIGQLDAIRP